MMNRAPVITTEKPLKQGSTKSKYAALAAVLVLVMGILLMKGFHPIVSILAIQHMLQIGAHGFYGLGLFTQSSLSSHPVSEYVDVGYVNSLKLKFLYFCRYQFNDNWLWEEWHKKLSDEIIAKLEAEGAKKDDETRYVIPNFDYNEISPETFFNDYVKMGRPAIIHNFPVKAMSWTPTDIGNKVGNYSTTMRCGNQLLKQTVDHYIQSKNDPTAPRCYLENNANIFLDNPEFEKDLQIEKLSRYAFGKPAKEGQKINGFFFAQLFFGMFHKLGVTYHCANYNNIFMMIYGEKKWSFVDSSHSWMLYPTFPRIMRNSISRLSWNLLHHPNSSELIKEHFPLFRYAPKYEYVLKPGDILFNPSWNWHLVENMGEESIGVATRWAMPAFYPYTNALFSIQHFTAYDFWDMIYNKVAHQMGVIDKAPFTPWSHFKYDDNLNFGRVGTIYKNRHLYQQIMPDWENYLAYLKEKSEEHGVDYIKLNE